MKVSDLQGIKVISTPTISTASMNNPFNMKVGPATQQYISNGDASVGRAATDGGNFLTFKDRNSAINAAKSLLFSSGTYKGLSVDQALKKWSNNGYGGNVVPALSSKSLDTLSPDEQTQVLNAMETKGENDAVPEGVKRVSDFKPGQLSMVQPDQSITTPSPATTDVSAGPTTISQKIKSGAGTVGKFIASSEIGLGKDAAAAATTILPEAATGLKQANEAQKNHIETITNLAKIIGQYKQQGKDPTKLQDALKNDMENAPPGASDLYPSIDKSNAEVIGDALGVGADILLSGAYGKSALGAESGSLLTKAANITAKKAVAGTVEEAAASGGKRFIQGAIKGAAKNAPIGAFLGVQQGLQQGESPLGIAKSAAEGGVFNAITGGLLEGRAEQKTGNPKQLMADASTQYKKALGATKEKYKDLSDKVIPDLLKNGIWGTRSGLLEKALSGTRLAGEEYKKLGELQGVAEIGGIEKKITDEMEKLKAPNGKILSINQTKYKALQGLMSDIGAYKLDNQVAANGGPVAAQQSLRDLASQYGDVLYESRKSAKTVSDNASLSQVQKVDGAIRDLLAKKNPEYADINKIYTLNSRLADILNETNKRESTSKHTLETVSGLIGAIGGFLQGHGSGPESAITGLAGALGMSSFTHTINSTWYNSLRAVQKYNFAQKLLKMPEAQRNQALVFLQREGAKYAKQAGLI